MAGEKIMPFGEKLDDDAPYFAMVLVPGRDGGHDGGRNGALYIVGLGPGDARFSDAGGAAPRWRRREDIIGYAPYVARVPERAGQTRLAERQSRRTRSRASRRCRARRRGASSRSFRAAIRACSRWRRRCSRRWSMGDPAWRDLDIRVLPGISAMQAAAARLGAPLGHDFCVISLSDNLKPWDMIAEASRTCGARRFRHRALQSRLARAAAAHSRRLCVAAAACSRRKPSSFSRNPSGAPRSTSSSPARRGRSSRLSTCRRS